MYTIGEHKNLIWLGAGLAAIFAALVSGYAPQSSTSASQVLGPPRNLSEDLLGRAFPLEATESQGYPVPIGQALTVVRLPGCDSCSRATVTRAFLLRARTRPLVCITEDPLSQVDPALLRDPDNFLVVAGADSRQVPFEFLASWPAAVEVRDGKVQVTLRSG